MIWQLFWKIYKPFCSLEFRLLIVAGYCIVPQANGQGAQQVLTKQILHVERKYPDSFIIALSDLNKGGLSHVPLRYKQFNKWCTGKSAYHAAPPTVHSHKPGTEERRGVTPHVFRVEHIAALRGVGVSARRRRLLGKSQKTLPLQNNWVGMAFDGGAPFEVTW